ncbi:MAG: PIN domain-containing protein [Actinobacteria bacterium]|nr:PIN domain-containing protein [Actinomycetota bacterium]
MCLRSWSPRFVTCCKRDSVRVAEADFLLALSRQEFDLTSSTTRDYARAAELVRKYSDLPLGAVDASVIAIAERLGDRDVATTTDRRHFYAVAEARGFTLHPAV